MKNKGIKVLLVALVASKAFQPILTVVLVLLLVVLAVQLLRPGQNNNNADEVRELSRKVSFNEASSSFWDGNYEVYTTGSLYVREDTSLQGLATTPTPLVSTPTPSVIDIPIIENKFDGMFFIIEKGVLKRIDTKQAGINASLFFNKKGEIVFMDHANKKYTIYKVPADSEQNAVQLFENTKLAFADRLFPFSPLLNDAKERKFAPTERAYNVYTGKWTNPVYTQGKTVDVSIQTDPVSGLFNSMYIASTNPPSNLSFDFRKLDSIENYDSIPEGYEAIDVPVPYKTK
jgi:hypothetical protein